ncbi:hypothetical protein PRZ48_002091 [Zasmidium cellare]|uniref:Uncharacterized protein n=1 Tax=Zasmidium cellare TaxID=395010 RepID=A0ABR0F4F4_ZASCE|nr:hypothetical protein PRZ48_002091 [Zasmidium cellare]
MPRHRVDMDQHKDFILERLKAGKPHVTVLKDLETERDLKISSSTLKRALTEWKFRANKREKLDDTEELRARVAYFFHELRLTDDETQKRLEEEGFSIGKIRLARLRKEMGLYKKCPPKEQELAEGAIAKALLQEIKNGGIEQMGRTKLYNYLRAKYNVVGR